MKKIFALIFLLFALTWQTSAQTPVWNPYLGSLAQTGNVPVSYTGGTFVVWSTYGYDDMNETLYNQIYAQLASDIASWGDWVRLTNLDDSHFRDYGIEIEIDENTTYASRYIQFGSGGTYLTLTQGYREYPALSPTGTRTVYPGCPLHLTLTATRPNVTYVLRDASDTFVTSVTGNGGMVTLDPVLEEGSYHFDFPSSSFSVVYPAFFHYNIELGDTETDEFNVGEDGGFVTVWMDEITDQDHNFVEIPEGDEWEEFDDVLSILNAGQSIYWDPNIHLVYMADSEGHVALTCCAGPNISSQAIQNVFPLSGGRMFRITQPGGGRLLDRAVVFSEGSSSLTATVRSSQYGVSYRLYRDGVLVQTVTGTGGDIFLQALPSGQGYQVEAYYVQGNMSVTKPLARSLRWGGELLSVAAAHNWILSQTFDTDASGQTGTSSDLAYYDGLGYPEQDVMVKASGNGEKDLVIHHEADHLFREVDAFLPCPATGGGSFQPGLRSLQKDWYQDACASANTCYESSSTGRVVWTRKPGQDYAQGNKKVSYDYGTNTAGSVYILTVAAGGSLSVNGYYPAGSLVRTRVTDEDGGAVETYADLSGQPVLERRQISASEWAETYYAYDGLGRLRRVISPEGSRLLLNHATYADPEDPDPAPKDEALNKVSFMYEYDGRGLLTKKWIPGVEVQTFTYNDAGQLVSSQDGNQRTGGKHRTYMYDGLDRLVEEYLKAGNDSTLLQQYVYDSYPSGMTSDLAFSAITGVTSVGGVSLKDNRTQGLLCYEKVNVLGTANHVERAHYYDRYGNVIQTVEKYPGGGVLRTSSRYSLGGNVLATDCRYTKNNTTYTLAGNNTYDTRGRILSATSTLNGSTTMSAAYAYDDLGRMVKTTYGNGVTDSLSYDLRGWRTVQTVKKGNTDIFSSVLRYNTAGYGANACWNGNIASQGWAHGNASQQNQGYLYDKMSRLIRLENEDDSFLPHAQTFSYDSNTNLEEIAYYNEENEFDDSDQFMLDGNRRMGCTYDANGNLTASGDGWTATYNLLNLPASATKGTGIDTQVSTWTYLADGTKIGAYHSWREEFDPSIGPGFPEEPAPEPGPGGSGVVPSGPNALQDPMYAIVGKDYIYAGPFRLVQEMFPASITLESVATVGGRIVKNGNNLQPRYYITDHLGSTRVVLDNFGSVRERYDYYPYGGIVPVTVANTGNTDYLYTGKESQNALFGINWYDSGARFQTTDGIFTGIDPLAEKYYHISPYTYCKGNPINRLDPNGLADWRMVRKGAGMALMGVGTAIGGGTITAGSAGTASPLGVFLIVEGAGQTGIGLSYMLAGLLEDPEHYSEEEIKNLPGSPSDALAKGADEAAGNENHEIETTVSVITAAISTPTLFKQTKTFAVIVEKAGVTAQFFILQNDLQDKIEDWLNEENTICVYDAKTSDKNPEEVIKQYLQGMLWIPNEEQ